MYLSLAAIDVYRGIPFKFLFDWVLQSIIGLLEAYCT